MHKIMAAERYRKKCSQCGKWFEVHVTTMGVPGGKEKEEPSSKVVQITEAVRVEGRSKNPDRNMKELTANDPASQNRQILEMHKAGKSNMVIARELGLGIGEVKLVIDLSNKHRKVR